MAKIGGELGAEHAAGRQRHEEHHGDRDEAEDRDRLEDVEQRDEQAFGLLVLGGKRRIGEGEEERHPQGNEYAQGRARGVFGQMRGVERQRLLLQLGERLQQVPTRLGQERQEPEDQEDREQLPSREQARPAADGNWHDHAHVRDSDSRLPLSHHLHENRGRDCASAAASFAR